MDVVEKMEGEYRFSESRRRGISEVDVDIVAVLDMFISSSAWI